MGTPKDLTLGHCSSESQAVHSSSNNGYHNDHRGSSTYSAAQDRLRTLKEERRKVEGFKRELPLCIQLLDNAINAAEAELAHGKDVVLPIALRLSSSPETENGGVLSSESGRPSLGEYIPLKRLARDNQSSDISGDGDGAEDYRETKCKHPPWMAEARRWNQTSQTSEFVHSERTRGAGNSEQEHGSVTSSQQQQHVTGAGSFLPFQVQQPRNVMAVVSRPRPRNGGFCADLNLSVYGERPATMLRLASDVEVGSTEAAAAAAVARQTPDEPTSKAIGTAGLGNISSSGGVGGGGISSSSTRKTRRCWSPELHSRFITALHQLGGPHIATPKQLRELMKVDGLTNDEVKSHLQKYRLHSRRPSCSSPHESAAATRAIAPHLVVVGGIWIPPQHAAPAAANSQAGSQSGVSDPSQFCHSTPLPLDYFATCISNGTPAAAGAAPLQMLQLHRQPVFKSPQTAGTSQSQTSPQGPLQVTSQLSGATQGSSSDTYETGEEEARSQSTSWNSGRQCEGQYMTVESSPREEPAESQKLDLKVHEHGNAVHSQSVGTSA